ncbi:MAG: hypothetical protein ABI459_08790 [Deltaproteobacteria bacterium]
MHLVQQQWEDAPDELKREFHRRRTEVLSLGMATHSAALEVEELSACLKDALKRKTDCFWQALIGAIAVAAAIYFFPSLPVWLVWISLNFSGFAWLIMDSTVRITEQNLLMARRRHGKLAALCPSGFHQLFAFFLEPSAMFDITGSGQEKELEKFEIGIWNQIRNEIFYPPHIAD